MKILAIISRTFVGLIFTFSGFVKAIDPLGSTYKFEDYFTAFGMDFFIPAAIYFSIILSGLEFFIGIGLLFNLFPRILSWFALIFMIFFTPLTFYIAINNPVTDCGCFGDALVITNWQTFYKNLIIIVFSVITVALRKHFKPLPIGYRLGLSSVFILFISLIMANGIRHLPAIDFRPYKIGNYLPDLMTVPEGAPLDDYIYMYTMTNTVSGEEKTIDSKEYMNSNIWEDTTWVITKTSDPILVKKGYHPPVHDFMITSIDGNDIADVVLDADIYCLLICYDLKDSDFRDFSKINQLALECKKHNIPFIAVTSSDNSIVQQIIEKYHPVFEFYYGDEINLKTIIRSNPGLFVLKKGTVVGKWAHRDMPSFKELEKVIR